MILIKYWGVSEFHILIRESQNKFAPIYDNNLESWNFRQKLFNTFMRVWALFYGLAKFLGFFKFPLSLIFELKFWLSTGICLFYSFPEFEAI